MCIANCVGVTADAYEFVNGLVPMFRDLGAELGGKFTQSAEVSSEAANQLKDKGLLIPNDYSSEELVKTVIEALYYAGANMDENRQSPAVAIKAVCAMNEKGLYLG